MSKRFIYLSSYGGVPLYSVCNYLQLDGINDVVKLVNTSDGDFILNGDPFTMSAYIQFDYDGGLQIVAGSWGLAGFRNWRLDILDVNTLTYRFKILTSDDGTGVGDNISTVNTFNYGQIYHIGMKLDVANLDYGLYIDGVSESLQSPLTNNTIGGSSYTVSICGVPTFFTDPRLYFFNLYNDYKSDADMLDMFSIADGLPYEPTTVNRIDSWDSNTVVWGSPEFTSLDGTIDTLNVAQSALISC